MNNINMGLYGCKGELSGIMALISGILLIVSLSACDKENTPIIYQIHGVVQTPAGDPIPEAAIHIKNYLEPGGFIESTGSSGVSIEFEVTESGGFTILLYRYGSKIPLATIFEGSLQSGRHRIAIADSLLSNGTYRYEITATSQQSERYFLINKPDSVLAGVKPFVRANADGEFSIPVNQLAIGEILRGSDGQNFFVGDSLQLMVTGTDSVIAEKRLKVSLREDAFIELEVQGE